MTWLRVAFAMGSIAAGLACSSGGNCGAVPCPPSTAYVGTPCGFTSVTSTCTGFQPPTSACVAPKCIGVAIEGKRAETCTVTVTYPDGTKGSTSITFRDGDDCCHGLQASSAIASLSPAATCATDAGTD